MGMFDAFFEDERTGFLQSGNIAQFTQVCIKEMIEVSNNNRNVMELTDEDIDIIARKLGGNKRPSREVIRGGINCAIGLLAAMFYYQEIGMISREELIKLIGGKNNYDVLQPLMEGMGKQTAQILRLIARKGEI